MVMMTGRTRARVRLPVILAILALITALPVAPGEAAGWVQSSWTTAMINFTALLLSP